MNELDQYVKRTLHCKHYGRYVDDFFIVSADKAWLTSLQQPIKTFLKEHLGLELNTGKTRICDVRHGIDFLGAYLKPHCRYVSNNTLGRMKPKIIRLTQINVPEKMRCKLNSNLGLLSHYKSYHLRQNALVDRIAIDDPEETDYYREIIYHNEPSSIDDWWSLADGNEIKYYLGNFPERV